MTDDQLKAFEIVITKHREELLNSINSQNEKSKLHLHGTTMDDVLKSVNELKEALEKIKDKTFGQCSICNDGAEVELERLECDYTTTICLSHVYRTQIKWNLRIFQNQPELLVVTIMIFLKWVIKNRD